MAGRPMVPSSFTGRCLPSLTPCKPWTLFSICLRAEVRWLETQPASEWATTRQVAMLDVIRLLDGGPWVEREHVTDGERCWCDPQVETVPAKKSATEAADSSIEGNDQ